jgi:hypothetical protein
VRNLFGAQLPPKFMAVVLFALASLSMVGCVSEKQTSESAFNVKPAGGQTNLVIAPTSSPVGRIKSASRQLKFVVIDFPVAQMPADGTLLSVFRAGTKVGEVKISGPAKGTFTVADIVSGSIETDDEVRAP